MTVALVITGVLSVLLVEVPFWRSGSSAHRLVRPFATSLLILLLALPAMVVVPVLYAIQAPPTYVDPHGTSSQGNLAGEWGGASLIVVIVVERLLMGSFTTAALILLMRLPFIVEAASARSNNH